MGWAETLGIGFTILLLLFISGLPVFVAFFLINVIGTLVVIGTAGFGMFANSVFD